MDMKKLLFLVGLIGAPLFAGIASDNLIKGLELVKNHKADWFNYEKEMHNAKYDLLKNEHNKMLDQKISTIKKFADGDLNEYEQTMLTNLLASHKAMMAQWKELGMSFQNKAKSIGERHAAELEKFQASLKPTTTDDETEEVDMQEMELE
jgi:hypothetical protein